MNREVSLIIIAMEEELSYFLDAIKGQYKEFTMFNETMYEYQKNGETYFIGRGKIGKVSTAVYLGRLNEHLKIKRIFNIGTSGGFDARLRVGDVVVADRVCYHDADATGFNYELGQIPGFPHYFECDNEYLEKKDILALNDKIDFKVFRGLVSSGDSFITKKNKDNYSIKEHGSLSCEMESGSVGQACYILNIPFVVVRSISDIVTANEGEAESIMNMDLSCRNCVKVLLELI